MCWKCWSRFSACREGTEFTPDVSLIGKGKGLLEEDASWISKLGNFPWVRFMTTSLRKWGGGANEPKAQEETGLSSANVHLCSFFLILRNNVWVLQSILDHKIEHTENAFYIVYFLENDLFRNQLWSRPTSPDNRPESPARFTSFRWHHTSGVPVRFTKKVWGVVWGRNNNNNK